MPPRLVFRKSIEYDFRFCRPGNVESAPYFLDLDVDVARFQLFGAGGDGSTSILAVKLLNRFIGRGNSGRP
jgi:hypothetical protein